MPDLRPLYPYAGGKRRYLEFISPFIQHGTHYVEPFFGGGAVFCYAFNLRLSERYIINDIREDIVSVYQSIKRNHFRVAAEFEDLRKKFMSLSIGDMENMFYEMRDKWEKSRGTALKLMLLNTSYGGLYQVDRAGVFNTNSGHMRFTRGRAIALDGEQICAWGDALQFTDIYSGDYRKVNVPVDSLVFCDPPYLDVGFVYDMPFSESDQRACFNWCQQSSATGDSTVIMTNNDSRGYFTNLCAGKRIRIIRYLANYSAGENTNGEEIAMIWNERKSAFLL